MICRCQPDLSRKLPELNAELSHEFLNDVIFLSPVKAGRETCWDKNRDNVHMKSDSKAAIRRSSW